MVWSHLTFLWHCEDSSAEDSEMGKKEMGRQKKRWKGNIKQWKGMEFGDFVRVAEDGERWKGNVATLSAVLR